MDEDRKRLSEQEALAILRHNAGFRDAREWISLAQEHYFERVDAETIDRCPDCRARERSYFGQYIYYSCLARLWSCTNCCLIWSDLRLPETTVADHFDRTYAESPYYKNSQRILARLRQLVADVAPRSGTVLDIGGGLGHLLARVSWARPDLHCVHNDLSEWKCDHARQKFDLDAVAGGLERLRQLEESFDILILSDVLYYFQSLEAAWSTFDGLLSERGRLMIRVPNLTPIISALQRWYRLLSSELGFRQTTVPFFNPEHLYLFSRRYLRGRLQALGFSQLALLPSPLRGTGFVGAGYYQLARMPSRILDDFVATPSMIVLAGR